MINIRPIESTDALSAVAKLHSEAFHDSLHIRLGPTYVRRMLEWFMESKDRIALAAYEDQGFVVGYALGAPTAQLHGMNRRLLPFAAQGVILRPWSLLNAEFRAVCVRRMQSLCLGVRDEPTVLELPPATISLVGIGVAKAAQGRGVGRDLVQAFIAAAAGLGAPLLELTVRRENAAAIRLYENSGWTRTNAAGELAATIRYVKRLDRAP